MRIHDITVTIRAGQTPVWPGDPQVERTLIWQIGERSTANVSHLALSAHTGTHVDAPVHFIAGAAAVETLDLNMLIGPCRVCTIETGGKHIGAGDLTSLALPPSTRRLLLKTANSRLWARSPAVFQNDFVALTADAAQWIVDHRIGLIGIDYLSVEPLENAPPIVHRTLLGAGVILLEGINLTDVPPGAYTLVCLPLKIAGSDGAPARAILIEDERGNDEGHRQVLCLGA